MKRSDEMNSMECGQEINSIECGQEISRIECRAGCGACCVAPSISSPIPGMQGGKKAGVRCVQLTQDNRCKLFGKPERPGVCVSLRPSSELCGNSNDEAMAYLEYLEKMTAPDSDSNY
jgi:Fe-S-cluster containining protein